MKDKPSVLAIINARGGSKGIPRKNVKPLKGKPLIEYSIEAGLAAKCIDRVLVSTEDEEIAVVAKKAGADVPFLRPAELATDDVRQIEVILHVLDVLKSRFNEVYDCVALLQPTSPFRTADDIDSAFHLRQKTRSTSVVSFTVVDNCHPYHMYFIDDQKPKAVLSHDQTNMQRQALPKAYIVNGALRIKDTDSLIQSKSFLSDDTVAYVMPRDRSVNLDEPFDWKLAELILESAVSGSVFLKGK